MFLSGDTTFVSFAVGTIVVVARRHDRLADRPAGDPVQARRPHRVRPHPVRRPPPRRPRGGPRLGRHPAPACCAARCSRPSSPAACSSPSRCRRPQLHTADSGMDALPKSMPELQTFHELDDAFPGSSTAAMVALRADDTPQTQRGDRRPARPQARASGEMQEPMDVHAGATTAPSSRSTSRSPAAAPTRSPSTPSPPSARAGPRHRRHARRARSTASPARRPPRRTRPTR